MHCRSSAQPIAGHVAGRALIWVAVLAAAYWMLAAWSYPGIDWRATYAGIDWRDPFVGPFTNPPWAVFLLPHAALDLQYGAAANMLLMILATGVLAWRAGGRVVAWSLLFTSPFFLGAGWNNNIDWIVAAGLLLPARFGVVLVVIKPQVVGGVVLVWMRRYGWRLFVPLAGVVVLSFALWGWWPPRLAGLPPGAGGWNFAPWPVGVIPGLWLLWQAWQQDDEWLSAVATPLLVPYVAGYSLVVPFAVLAGRWPRAAVVAWFVAWWFAIVELRRM